MVQTVCYIVVSTHCIFISLVPATLVSFPLCIYSLSLSLQNMCMLESELENQLGEFHVKMKGKTVSVYQGNIPF